MHSLLPATGTKFFKQRDIAVPAPVNGGAFYVCALSTVRARRERRFKITDFAFISNRKRLSLRTLQFYSSNK